MRIFDGLRPHSRWRREVDAYVDGELTPARLLAFERHAAGCLACAAAVADHRALKQVAAALPLAAAPRSFRLTAGAVAAPARRPAPAPAGSLALRLSQVGAAVAGLALIATLTIDYRGDASGPAATRAPAVASLSSEGGAAGKVPAAAPRATAASPALPAPGRDTAAPTEEAPLVPSPGGGAPAAAAGHSRGEGSRSLRPLEVGLGVLLAASLAATFIFASRQRRTHP